jgi:hypothetical protein
MGLTLGDDASTDVRVSDAGVFGELPEMSFRIYDDASKGML